MSYVIKKARKGCFAGIKWVVFWCFIRLRPLVGSWCGSNCRICWRCTALTVPVLGPQRFCVLQLFRAQQSSSSVHDGIRNFCAAATHTRTRIDICTFMIRTALDVLFTFFARIHTKTCTLWEHAPDQQQVLGKHCSPPSTSAFPRFGMPPPQQQVTS